MVTNTGHGDRSNEAQATATANNALQQLRVFLSAVVETLTTAPWGAPADMDDDETAADGDHHLSPRCTLVCARAAIGGEASDGCRWLPDRTARDAFVRGVAAVWANAADAPDRSMLVVAYEIPEDRESCRWGLRAALAAAGVDAGAVIAVGHTVDPGRGRCVLCAAAHGSGGGGLCPCYLAGVLAHLVHVAESDGAAPLGGGPPTIVALYADVLPGVNEKAVLRMVESLRGEAPFTIASADCHRRGPGTAYLHPEALVTLAVARRRRRVEDTA